MPAPAAPVLPGSVEPSLSKMRGYIPAHCFRPHTGKALFYLLTAILEVGAASVFAYIVWLNEWYALWPAAWFVGGVAFTSWFVVGHDCGHYAFLKNRRAMVAVGHVLMAPLFYPFYAWKYSHDAHHKNTNRLERTDDVYFDNAWIPHTVAEHERMRTESPWVRRLYRLARRLPAFGSLLHLPGYLFQAGMFRKDHRRKVLFSYAFVAVVCMMLVPAIYFATNSWFAVLHFWILPALLFQIWMSTYTFLHHTAEDIPFYAPDEWTPFKGQALSTVNVRFPAWLSFLHFHIDVHIPHHVAPNLPAYHLKQANAALQASPYGAIMKEMQFSWGYLFRQIRACRLWDEEHRRYVGLN